MASAGLSTVTSSDPRLDRAGEFMIDDREWMIDPIDRGIIDEGRGDPICWFTNIF